VGGNFWLSHAQAVQTDQVQQTNRFIETARAFDPLFAKYNDDLAHGRRLDAARAAIEQNIILQHQMLATVSAYLPRDRRPLSDQYGVNLVNIDSLLDKTQTVLEAGPLEQELAYAVRARQLLVSELRRDAGLQARDEDAPAG
jgi:hypothetical protein